jgi:hypothetical protein
MKRNENVERKRNIGRKERRKLRRRKTRIKKKSIMSPVVKYY